MKAYHLFGLLLLLVVFACTPKYQATTSTAKPTKAQPTPTQAPTPTTASTRPPVPGQNDVPATYGSPGLTPRSPEMAPTTYANAAAVAAPLIGSWINNSDPDETVLFTDHSYASFYKGQEIIEEEMTYHPLCPGSCSGGASAGVPCFTISSEYGTDCFGIIRVTENELELSMLGVSTETIKYTRLEP
ncbi:MAG: hypothetical protein AAF828_05670 [Bacteroidota bacterium]